MEQISLRDREILREVAERKAALANCPRNDEILKQWAALAEGRRETPTVRLPFGNFSRQAVNPRLRCEGQAARDLESALVWSMTGRELFDDDTPLFATFDVNLNTWAKPFGIDPQLTRARSSGGYHIDPVIEDLEEDFEKLKGGSFGADREKTKNRFALAEDVFGDILKVQLMRPSLCAPITHPLVMLMGMENYYMSMYDCPETLHKVMDMATTLYEQYFDFLEQEGLLVPTCGDSFVNQDSFAFNCELPTENVTKTTQCWGFLESQETTAVSPETFGEFVFPYQDRLVKRFGLLSYGCCERVDAIFPEYLSKWKNLRKLSVSPFNDQDQVGEYLRGSNVVFYSKPRADLLPATGPLDEDALRRNFKKICTAASGCMLEIAQREVMILWDMERGRRYIEIAKECVREYWKP